LSDIFYGANQVDYSNYPDCRPEFIRAFVQMANLGTRTGLGDCPVKVHAPLLDLTKAEIIALGTALGIDYAQTVSCYDADAQGQACGQCDACRFRAAGFEAAGIMDPTRYR
jgi:7-cyano-7-deazaguanine synthase